MKTSVRIIALLRRNPTMTLIEVASATGRSVSAVEQSVTRLVKAGRLRHVGPRKGGHWEVLE